MTSRWARYYQLLFGLLIFVIPSNLFVKGWESTAYVNGLMVDYLLPKLYLSDVVIWGLLVGWGAEKWYQTTHSGWLKKSPVTIQLSLFIVLTSIFFGRQFVAPHPVAALWFGLKLLEMGLLSAFLISHSKVWTSKLTLIALQLTLFFQSGLSLFQFHWQRSLTSYYFLGETNFAHSIGLAKASFGGAEKILPYGTTSHPNVLGGGLVFFWLSSLLLIKQTTFKNRPLWYGGFGLLTGLTLYTLWLTQSVSAGLMLVMGLIVIFNQLWVKKVLNHWPRHVIFGTLCVWLVMPFFIHGGALKYAHANSLVRRDYLNQSALTLFLAQPVMGSGLNNFTAVVEKYSPSAEVVRFVQPVHHLGLLWLAETGLIGVGWLLLLMNLNQKLLLKIAPGLLVLLPLASLDHYLLTHQTGLMLLTLWVSLTWTLGQRRGR